MFVCQSLVQAEEPAAATPQKALQIGSLRVGKILFLGNSITLHPPALNIGWSGNWGMAASAADKDYVHLLVSRVAKAAGGEPKVLAKNIADFERKLGDYDLRANLKDAFDFAPDVVIVAVGENAAAVTSEKAKGDFKTAFSNLLAELKQQGKPRMIVRSSFWADPAKDEIMRSACKEAGGVFVDISKLGHDKANSAASERKIAHGGVAAHPGDRGMQGIADALWSAFQAD